MMERREFIKATSLAGLAVATGGLTPLLASDSGTRLVILHTNDMHSRIEPFPEDGRRNAGTGGMAYRAALIKKIRAEGHHVLLLDSGDIFQGTPYFNYFGGELEFKLMTGMGYDAATLGNHDFDNGLSGLERMLPHAEFPFLVANYDFDKTRLANRFEPFKVFKKGPVKIGVFGLGIELDGLVTKNLFEGTIYLDPVAVAREMVARLKKDGCHYIICLSHLGYKYEGRKVSDILLAQQVDGIDLILGGHTHTFLQKPYITKSPNGSDVYINQVGWAGINLGRIDLNFKRKNAPGILRTATIEISEKSSA